MRLSELIRQLEAARARHGDLDVFLYGRDNVEETPLVSVEWSPFFEHKFVALATVAYIPPSPTHHSELNDVC